MKILCTNIEKSSTEFVYKYTVVQRRLFGAPERDLTCLRLELSVL